MLFTSNRKEGSEISKLPGDGMAINMSKSYVGKRKLDLWGSFVWRADIICT